MEENDSIDLRKYISAMRRHKYWYLIAFVVMMALGITYHFIHMDAYYTYATVLIEDDNGESGSAPKISGGLASMMRTFSIGGMGNSSVDNELLIFQSHDVQMKVVKRLNINRTYIERRNLKKYNLYDETPVLVSCADSLLDTISTGLRMTVDIKKSGKVDIELIEPGFFGLGNTTLCTKKDVVLPTELNTIYGKFQVYKSKHFTTGEERTIRVNLSNTHSMANAIHELIYVDYASKKGDGVALSFKTTNKKYGMDILNGIIAIYNEIRMNRKNDRALQSIEFYDKQIADIAQQISDVEARYQDFQTKNNLINPSSEASFLYATDKEAEKTILQQNNLVKAYDLILSVINDENRRYDLLPSTTENESVNTYNELILQKQQIEASANGDNPAVRVLKTQIDAMRDVVRESVEISKRNTLNTIAAISSYSGKYRSKLNKVPELQREFINITRDQALMNELYAFLLEKRYSNAMTLSLNFPRGFVIDPAYCDIKPLKTKSLIALAACFAMSLILPTVVICYLVNRKRPDDDLTIEDED